ncbi:hypothetical protein HMPREF9630_00434 [Peptoanaerobacter stomatis]|uniref:Protein-glutamate methylesterase/protein-glutamine glutaminase n=1 Tax=Peptoanaerobacter stomatis TaxID=796937 RepID=J5WF04_9FIRM|nr:chemotaxis response regulator protein-glutamate methylesterase [Peptoanaerobacter stomatis]EHL17267.1 hypothetical protein HMPREF9630_00434 [Peptoanaerobacter stomatis]EJU21487.1 putative chemotaxis response regulator protein-glutamate methylesterase [Peptoanaerobacter stomatis]NWO24760.1 chemotaxis response regulator protein-glutamate methylesterase [Peptostreptococcaceae bacterium oral taxon 081]
MTKNIRVLNVDDSAFIRKLLKDILGSDDDFAVVDQAKNGKEAIEKIKQNKYDVITLDIEMPIMDGLTTLKEIMKVCPTPVVMMSSLTKEGEQITLDALNLGAVDFITKPKNVFSVSSDEMKAGIIDKIKNARKANMKMVRYSSLSLSRNNNHIKTPNEYNTIKNADTIKTIIAIGTSTGGPRALHEVIPNISGKVNAPILIVQHMPKGFTKSLADRLDLISNVKVKEAEDGEVLKNGWAYIAPGGIHMKIKSFGVDKFKIFLDDSENVNGHKPSVDAMMFSVSQSNVREVVSVVMTGMGNDGAKGLETLKIDKKAKTIAEDEKTCIVFGMPKAAIETGKVDFIVPLNKIADEINKIMGV